MKCPNCLRNIPKDARSCQYCEAKLPGKDEEPLEEEMQDFTQALMKDMPPEQLAELSEMAGKFDTADEFANSIFIGDCPECGSSKVDNCEEYPGLEDVTVGHCLNCGLFWCSVCGIPLKKDQKECGHWALCETCPENDNEMADCLFEVCEKVEKWAERQRRGRKPALPP